MSRRRSSVFEHAFRSSDSSSTLIGGRFSDLRIASGFPCYARYDAWHRGIPCPRRPWHASKGRGCATRRRRARTTPSHGPAAHLRAQVQRVVGPATHEPAAPIRELNLEMRHRPTSQTIPGFNFIVVEEGMRDDELSPQHALVGHHGVGRRQVPPMALLLPLLFPIRPFSAWGRPSPEACSFALSAS